jgi:hypothetical protein
MIKPPTARKPFRMWRKGGLTALIVLLCATAPAGPAPTAEERSVATHGNGVYERAKNKVRDQFGGKESFTVEPYDKAEIKLEPDCVFSIRGRFHFSVKNKINRKIYSASMTPKATAPGGFQVLSYDVGGG